MKAFSGSLLSLDVLQDLDCTGRGPALSILTAHAFAALGPASAARPIFDRLVKPLAAAAGLQLSSPVTLDGMLVARLGSEASIAAGGWNADLRRMRDASRHTCGEHRWWIGVNGVTMRIVDARAAYARRAADVALPLLPDDPRAAAALLHLLTGSPIGQLQSLAALVSASDAHRSAVSTTLRGGVEDALVSLVTAFTRARRRARLDDAMAESLTMVYRILFLLFAESRSLVPRWHPTYRRGYTIESLREVAERRGAPTGLWAAMQAISRLSHRGCRAGTLKVSPFNGRLFAPSAAPLADSLRLDDRLVRDAVLSLTTRAGKDRRERISYADLGVEQLGAVYESVLDYAPAPGPEGVALRPTGRRKSTGTFYTPRAITEYLVRRTLAPLVRDRSPEAILSLHIVDPAMGSGAFLVEACRYLADAYERALIREGVVSMVDLSAGDRAAFRRIVAQRCLYGVDRNPTAVQLARLSLWLCTLAAGKPLSFFDHHLRAGNSLAGAGPADIRRQPPGHRGRLVRAQLPLFDLPLEPTLASAIALRTGLMLQPDDSHLIVRKKEQALSAYEKEIGSSGSWKVLADAWSAAWFSTRPMPPALWGAIASELGPRTPAPAPRMLVDRIQELRTIAERESFFHWELEFPEVFHDRTGRALDEGGFDAVIGNPPWDMLRGPEASAPAAFARHSGCYRWQGDGHTNLYQLFAERMIRLARPGGRIGMLMPSGLVADYGSSTLRRLLFGRCEVDAMVMFQNSGAIFPIHRGLKFVLVTATAGGTTPEVTARFDLRDPAGLETIPDEGEVPDAVRLPLPLVREFSGESLALPEIRSVDDRQILTTILSNVPRLADADGWGARFGRELNATDDKGLFGNRGLPVLEGKSIEPFIAHLDRSSAYIAPADAKAALGGTPFLSPRLAYREVASATNRRTLIAAIIPARTLTTHTLFCLKTRLPDDVQWFLCGVFNSAVANYLVRIRGGTHIPATVIHQLPVPVLPAADQRLRRVARAARTLARQPGNGAAFVEVQAEVAALYGLSPAQLEHVLGTLPRWDADLKAATRACYHGRF